ncbi:putative metal-binding motif-containing protein [Myxococcota bacterium]|nr:putative metal-binding motif-containing protein [Myxococcota bacterium]
MLLLALSMPSLAADFLQVDAGAPGMAVQVHLLREDGGFDGSELVTTDCADILVGPVRALDRNADPSDPIPGAVLSTVFAIADDAATGVDCTVFVDGVAVGPYNDGIDNAFRIVPAAPSPVDGGAGDADGTVDGVITIAAADRTDGGTLVLSSLDLPADTTLWFETSDPIDATEGNEAFLPVVLLVQGDATVAGTIAIEGEDGDDAPSGLAADGGDGGPGGGGGGVGSNCMGPAYAAGAGFSGGGGTAAGTCIDFGYGGVGAAEGPDLEHGGEGIFTDVENGALGYAGGTGGGTGVPWGTGGFGGYCCGTAGEGGYGGGGGNGHSEASGWGAGGGGFGTAGENGIGVVGGGASSYLVGGAGLASLHDTLVPLAGGSGGAGGDSGSGVADGGGGGGGGGALLLAARSLSFEGSGGITAWGGDGGDTVGTNPGSSLGGAGGSGGGVHLAAWSVRGLSADAVELHGGYGGHEYYGYTSGDGGEGRLRVDGAAPPTLPAGPTGAAAPTWQGAAISDLDDTDLAVSSSGSVTLHVYGSDGTEVAEIPLAEDGALTLYPYLGGVADSYLLVLVDDATGTMSPAGTALLRYRPDADGDGALAERYDGDDCDDGDASINPDADELCDGIDNDCDGEVDEADAADAGTWYTDGDGDGWGDLSTEVVTCDPDPEAVSVPGDCDDTEAEVNPDAAEVCDGIDNDCDGTVDNDDALDAATWYADLDGDGWGDGADSTTACEDPGDGWVAEPGDCDDLEADAFPGNTEVCDGIDNDCDGTVDNDDAVDASTWYSDEDGDGWGVDDGTTTSCVDPGDGWAAAGGDCDDGDTAYHPGAEESDCSDPNDYNCDGSVAYEDVDGDGFAACEECDDRNAAVNPDAVEVCNGIDDDCDRLVDEEVTTTFYADGDEDGWGSSDITAEACEDPGTGWVAEAGDCDDTDAAFHPGAEEKDCSDPNDYNCDGSVAYEDADEDGWAACEECNDADAAIHPEAEELCNGVDDDCDTEIDEGVTSTWYQDGDGDGFGDLASPAEDCTQPEGTVEDATDCDDESATVYPGAEEIPDDGIDQDCDGEDLTTPTGDGGTPTDGGTTDGGSDELDGGGKVVGGCDGCAAAPGRSTGGVGVALLLGLLGLLRRRR